MDANFQHLLIGAFVHDIGKVMQRAEVAVTEQAENFMASAGPSRDGHSTHYHVKWTSEFFQQHFADLDLPAVESIDDQAEHIAFKHHNPSTPSHWIVAEADRLSSGMERGESKYEKNIHKKKRLIPLRSLLTVTEHPNQDFPSLPLTPLTSTDESNYPGSFSNDEDLTPQYKKLWNGFLGGWSSRRSKGSKATLALVDALYERYFWSVPSSTIDLIPDSSLYDHSRTVTALAACLYQYHVNSETMAVDQIKDRSQDKFLLLSGDLSGIQRFIFAIAHLGAGKVAKRLRARSFFVSRITQIAAAQLLDTLGLPHVNQTVSAGGKFVLLLPNTDKVKAVIAEKQRFWQNWLHDEFQGLLSINLAQQPLSGDDLMNKRITERFDQLNQKLALAKHRPLDVFLQNGDSWNEDAFVVPEALIKDESASGLYDIPSPYDEERLGTALPKAKCLAVYPNAENGDYRLFDWSFSVADESAYFGSKALSIHSFKRGAENQQIDPATPVYYEYRASHIPLCDQEHFDALDDNPDEVRVGQPLPFTELARQTQGRKSIAYLKADVDNLGLLLKEGLSWHPNGWTLSKITSFSRSLEYFFAGRIHNLLSGEDGQFKYIYTVFSGGDDVLLVGPWDVIHDFALRLHQEWKAFTADNPQLTLSLGITLERPLTPVWAAAEEAEEALNAAKRIQAYDDEPPKDQIVSFNHVMKWYDAEYVFEEIDRVSGWLANGDISSSFARNLIYFGELASRYRNEGFIEGLRYLPMLSYQLSRRKHGDEINQWAEKLKNPEGDLVRHVAFIVNYALNLHRGK